VETLKAIGIQVHENASGHGELVNCLGGCNDPGFAKTSARLRTLHSRRIQADYAMKDVRVETRAEAEAAYLEAQKIISEVDALKNDSGNAIARSEMKRFARDALHLQVS
jgi:hypothetical protein